MIIEHNVLRKYSPIKLEHFYRTYECIYASYNQAYLMIDKAEISLKRLHEDLVVVIKVIMYFTTELLQKFYYT